MVNTNLASPDPSSGPGAGREKVSFFINGRQVDVDVDPSTPLVYVLRNTLGLRGTKIGCSLEQCGACAVLVDDEKQLSCTAPVGTFEGRRILTVEADNDPLVERVRRAFVEAGAAQCGYCIPGIVMAAAALLRHTAHPAEPDIRRALQQHLCRCGTHVRVLAAVRRLAEGGAA